jgi:microcystin-dependent protein
MSTPYLGEIRAVGFTFSPVGWATCNGQSLAINENAALFTLIGTTYGGDGVNTFNVPNLNGAVIVGAGQGNGLSNYVLGQQGGSATVTLTANQLPVHSHSISGALGANADGTPTDEPAGNVPGPLSAAYSQAPTPDATLNAAAMKGNTTVAGSSLPHENMQPSLALNYIICVAGIFPSRP